MKSSVLVSLLSFAVVLSFSTRIQVSGSAKQHTLRPITLSQTGTDPEPINPPSGNGPH